MGEDMLIEEEKGVETRIDEFGISIFENLGFEGRLPDKLVEVYSTYKRIKDSLSPGRLTPDGFANVITIYRYIDGGI